MILRKFIENEITITQLKRHFGGNLHRVKVPKPETVYAKDVISLIKKYVSNTITKQELLDWVNVVWFTELYEYNSVEEDTIASVMTELETLDEEGVVVLNEEFSEMIKALLRNKEYEKKGRC